MTARDAGYAQMTPAQMLDFAIDRLRADFLAQPEAKRRETIARVQRLLEAERRRKQNQPSWLKQHYRKIYGREL